MSSTQKKLFHRIKSLPLKEVLVPFFLSRLFVLSALVVAHEVVIKTAATNPKTLALYHERIFGWDAGYYIQIATSGYGSHLNSSIRFFPLFPLVGKIFSLISFIPTKYSLLIISNVATLAAGFVIYEIAATKFSKKVASLGVWICLFAPASYALVAGYSDSLLILLESVVILAATKRRTAIVLAAGFLAGLDRPTGVVLSIFIFFEYLTYFHRQKVPILKSIFRAVLPSIGPGLGTVTFLSYALYKYHDFFAPLSTQLGTNHRGSFTDPFVNAVDSVKEVFTGHIGSFMHLPWVVVAIVILMLGIKKVPFNWSLYAGVSLILILISKNLDGFERYLGDIVPLLVVGAYETDRVKQEKIVVMLLAVTMMTYSVLALIGVYTP